MEKLPEDYHISFFKPTTPRAKSNRNLALWLVSIWFLAIFGFHIVLRLIEKPTPEPAYLSFETAWNNMEMAEPTDEDFRLLGRSSLSVLGKIDISPEAQSVLEDAFSWSVYQLVPEAQKPELINTIREFEEVRAAISDLSDERYNELKIILSDRVTPVLDLSPQDARSKIIPFGLVSEDIAQLSGESREKIPLVMQKYLIHNQSVLTDTKFLGFPFHYFYSSVFLLVLFVVLCWVYCIRTDVMNKRLEISD